MHLEEEDRWRESAFRFLVTCNVIAHPFGSYSSPRAHMRKPLSPRHKCCNTASEWAWTHARQLFCPLVWFSKISQIATLKIKPLRHCSSLSDQMKDLEVIILITDMANTPRITNPFLIVGYTGNRWTDMFAWTLTCKAPAKRPISPRPLHVKCPQTCRRCVNLPLRVGWQFSWLVLTTQYMEISSKQRQFHPENHDIVSRLRGTHYVPRHWV